MALPTAQDIVRIFGSPTGATNPLVNMAPTPSVNLAPAPPAPNMGGVPPPVTGAPLAPPSFPRPPATAPPGGVVGGVPSPAPVGAPLSSSGSQFQPQQYEPSFDPQLMDTVRQRSQGIGVGPTYEQIVQGTFNPLATQIDTAFDESESRAARDLARRGILSGGEAANVIGDLRSEQGRQKAALAGQLALDFENNRQQNINQALQQYAGLENGRVQAKTQITTANIGAAAQVQSASIMASAQVASANAGANAQVAAARIGAQAALQRSNNDFNIAMRSLDQELVFSGIDPVRLETDPIYRGDTIAYRAFVENAKNELIFAQTNAILGLTPRDTSGFRQ